MTYQPFDVARFGGINLRDDPEEIGTTGATDLLNVDLGDPGRVRTRDGTANWTTSDAVSQYRALFSIDRAGFVLALRATSSGNQGAAFANFGTPTNSYTYMSARAAGAGTFELRDTAAALTSSVAAGTQIQRLSGSTFSSPAALAAVWPYSLAVQPLENRLVGGGTVTNTSRVLFSDAGDPETFGANNYVELTPGDGEVVTALVSWRGELYAFKQSKFFVFYGNSTSSTGTPVFNYRMVDGGYGAEYMLSAVAGDDGIYFANRTGVYRTTGGLPVEVSLPVRAFFMNTESPHFALTDVFVNVNHMAYVDGRVIVGVQTVASGADPILATPTYTLVFDTRTQQWTIWNVAANAYAGLTLGLDIQPSLLFTPYGVARIRKHTSGLATDNGVAMVSRYKSGFYDLGSPGAEAFTRWTRLRGSGAPTVDVYTDEATSDPLSRGAAVTLGTSPAVAEGYHLKSYNGRMFSHKFSASSGAWSVSRLIHDIAFVRP